MPALEAVSFLEERGVLPEPGTIVYLVNGKVVMHMQLSLSMQCSELRCS